ALSRLSRHDALPICRGSSLTLRFLMSPTSNQTPVDDRWKHQPVCSPTHNTLPSESTSTIHAYPGTLCSSCSLAPPVSFVRRRHRSEEHTSELQSRFD